MIEFIFSLFGSFSRLFMWMPSYLYSFVELAFDVAAVVLMVVIAAKGISFGSKLFFK